jgi:hypothetical protein
MEQSDNHAEAKERLQKTRAGSISGGEIVNYTGSLDDCKTLRKQTTGLSSSAVLQHEPRKKASPVLIFQRRLQASEADLHAVIKGGISRMIALRILDSTLRCKYRK